MFTGFVVKDQLSCLLKVFTNLFYHVVIFLFKYRCGMKQSGGYLDGVAPDGLLGLGLSKISIPSFLSKAGLIQNSFSLCFDEDNSGRIFFGDQGPATQQSTPFLKLNGN